MNLTKLAWGFSLAVAVAVAVAVGAGLAVYDGVRERLFPEAPPPVVTVVSEAPWTVVHPPPQGTLEVSQIRAPAEVIERTDTAQWGPVSLGTNFSRLRVNATYRYHIPLAADWKVVRKDGRFIVIAPRVEPTLDVAFDTASLQTHTDAGWLRFDKADSQAKLLKAVTAELNKRSASPGAIAQQREVARRTVSEFVAKWLITQTPYKGVTPEQVDVVFADEPVERLRGAAVPFSGL